jgi:hypothetical protein
MTRYDAFNGDADGICALHQLRLADPQEAILVTGVKRDIALLKKIDARAGDRSPIGRTAATGRACPLVRPPQPW